jgi:hypothetical protein
MDEEKIVIVTDPDDKKDTSGSSHFFRAWYLHYLLPALIVFGVGAYKIDQQNKQRDQLRQEVVQKQLKELRENADPQKTSDAASRLLGIDPKKDPKPQKTDRP